MVAPVVSNKIPNGTTEDPNVNVSFRISAAPDDIDLNTLDVYFNYDVSGVKTVINNGVFQTGAGFNGTITPVVVDKTYDVTISTHPFFEVTLQNVSTYCEDEFAVGSTDGWSFNIASDPPVASNFSPYGIASGTLDAISAVVNDDWGIVPSTINLSIQPAASTIQNAIVSGAFQTGYSGVIIEMDDIGGGPRYIEIIVKSWPSILNGRLTFFSLDLNNVAQVSL